VGQSFYAGKEKSIEVFDLVSSLILYDRMKNEIIPINEEDTIKYLRTFPSWSPNGKYLYYCRALNSIPSTNPGMDDILSIHHNLVRKSFNSDSSLFGKTEVVFNASEINKSVSFPRISPDGKNLVFTLHDYGTFPIWHREADLYLLNTGTLEYKKMSLNSNESESYHSWSSNGKWLVFSSKRTDGRSTRPFFAYMDSWEHTGKPFILPQKDPGIYERMLESFNIPELITGRIKLKPRDFEKATQQDPIKPDQGNKDKKVKLNGRIEKRSDSTRLFHQ
jgi:dipeptidyl aminopeptidase/acylaminoacyl peptidase